MVDVEWRWVAALAVTVVAVSALFSVVYGVPLLAVLKPFAGLAVLGVVVGWVLRHIAEFNPYEY